MSINVKYSKVFKGLGIRYIELRLARKMVQKDEVGSIDNPSVIPAYR